MTMKSLASFGLVVAMFAAMIAPTYYLAFNKGFEACQKAYQEIGFKPGETPRKVLRKPMPPIYENDQTEP